MRCGTPSTSNSISSKWPISMGASISSWYEPAEIKYGSADDGAMAPFKRHPSGSSNLAAAGASAAPTTCMNRLGPMTWPPSS